MKKEKSCGTIVVDNEKVLMIKHIKGHWDFPKGHVEEGESEIQTAMRETKEETNIDVNINLNKIYRYSTEYSPEEGVWKEVIYFIATPTSNNPIPQETEVQTVEWVEIDEALKRITFDNMREVFERAMKDFGKIKD